MEVVAEFSIDTAYKNHLFKLVSKYDQLHGIIKGYNQFVWDNPEGLVDEIGFDVLWVLLFGNWDGSYLKTKRLYHRQKRRALLKPNNGSKY